MGPEDSNWKVETGAWIRWVLGIILVLIVAIIGWLFYTNAWIYGRLEHTMEVGFAAITNQVEELGRDIRDLSDKLVRVEERLDKLEERVSKLEQGVAAIIPQPFVELISGGGHFNLKDLTLTGEGRYPTVAFKVSGRARNLDDDKVYLVVNPTYPSGGGVWVQEEPAQVGKNGEFTATAYYGVDQEWPEPTHELEIFAIILPSGTIPPRDRIEDLQRLNPKADSNRLKITISK